MKRRTPDAPAMSHDERGKTTFRERARRLCRERGLRVTPYGQGFEVRGPGIDLLVADLSVVTPADLVPAHNGWRPLRTRGVFLDNGD